MREARTVQNRAVGSLYVDTKFEGKHVTQYGVFVQGDGTLQGDTTCLAIVWDDTLAPLLKEWFENHGRIYISEASADMQIFRERERKCPECGAKHIVGKRNLRWQDF